MKKLMITFSASLISMLSAYGGEVRNLSMHSDVLGTDKTYTVYLPDGYEEGREDYPVLYLLHGAWGIDRDWTEKGDLREIADLTIKSGLATPMIIVMPDARGTGENFDGPKMGYFNVPGWEYERYFHEELIPEIDRSFRTIPDKGHRAIAGLSMGGGGSIAYAQMYPDFYGTSCSLSGCVGFCSSDSAKALDAEFDKSLGRTDPTLFVNNATPGQLDTLRETRWYVDCGDDDFLYEGNLAFFDAMRKHNVPIEYRMRDGAHNWTYWKTALPSVLQYCSMGFNTKGSHSGK